MLASLVRYSPYLIPAIYGANTIYNHLVTPRVTPAIGSILHVSLLGPIAEHTGIYIGEGKIVHRNGKGVTEAVDDKEFLRKTTGLEIYISSTDEYAVGSFELAKNAINQIGQKVDYSLYNKNCHQFVASCITGKRNSSIFLFRQIEWLMKSKIGADNWLIWDRS